MAFSASLDFFFSGDRKMVQRNPCSIRMCVTVTFLRTDKYYSVHKFKSYSICPMWLGWVTAWELVNIELAKRSQKVFRNPAKVVEQEGGAGHCGHHLALFRTILRAPELLAQQILSSRQNGRVGAAWGNLFQNEATPSKATPTSKNSSTTIS